MIHKRTCRISNDHHADRRPPAARTSRRRKPEGTTQRRARHGPQPASQRCRDDHCPSCRLPPPVATRRRVLRASRDGLRPSPPQRPRKRARPAPFGAPRASTASRGRHRCPVTHQARNPCQSEPLTSRPPHRRPRRCHRHRLRRRSPPPPSPSPTPTSPPPPTPPPPEGTTQRRARHGPQPASQRCRDDHCPSWTTPPTPAVEWVQGGGLGGGSGGTRA